MARLHQFKEQTMNVYTILPPPSPTHSLRDSGCFFAEERKTEKKREENISRSKTFLDQIYYCGGDEKRRRKKEECI